MEQFGYYYPDYYNVSWYHFITQGSPEIHTQVRSKEFWSCQSEILLISFIFENLFFYNLTRFFMCIEIFLFYVGKIFSY